MRERTTWNREQIAKLAASFRKAEDPRAMNQDHLKQQPAADKYEIGGPSEFAEDIHPSNNTWKAEYSGGEVKRNEIGMPEMRGDTFNHAEKTAGSTEKSVTAQEQEQDDDDFLEKKADVCINLAKRMLPKTASDSVIEDQAFALMYMPDSKLVETANRLAAQDEEQGQQDQGQQKQAQQDQGQQDQGQQKQAQQQDQGQQDQGQQKQAQQQDQGQQDQGQKQAQQQQDQGQQAQDKQAGQIPENFLKDKKDEGGDKDEKKEASDQMAMYSQQACTALQNGDEKTAQQVIQQMAQYAQQQQQKPMMSQEQAQQKVQQMFAQMMQSMGGQQQQPTMADDQLLDQMLQQPTDVYAGTNTAMTQTAATGGIDIELMSNSMDVTETKLGSEDEALATLFASNPEVMNANQANALQGLTVQASGGMTRTAATRTVGTRPNGGVSQLGGGTSEGGASGGSEVDKLSGLWSSAPDVKSVFE